MGNRTNLLFVETCLEHIKSYKNSSRLNPNNIEKFESAILGLQCGHHGMLREIIEIQERKNSPDTFQDDLWSIFRSASSQIRLNQQIDAIVESKTVRSELDDHLNMYSEILDISDLKNLKKSLLESSPVGI
jgi:hypothetical protein